LIEGRLNSKICHARWSLEEDVVTIGAGKDLINSGEKKAPCGELASVKTTSFSRRFF
jgi:hypothetical protein